MENNKLIRNVGIVGSVIGAVITGYGLYKYNNAKMMSKALSDGGSLFGYDNSTRNSINIWDGHAQNYKLILIVGAIILVIGIILLISGIVSNGDNKTMQQQNINIQPEKVDKTTSEKLKELDDLKANNMITNEEYDEQRKRILSSL